MMEERQKNWSDAGWLAACWMAWILAGLLPALFFFRFLYADGAYFYLRILEGRSVFFPAEGRSATYLLTQWPAPLAMLAGGGDIRWLAWCFGAGLMLVPALLHGAALWLMVRRGLKLQALVYLVMLWLLMGFGGLCIVTDSHTPTAVFLLAVVLTASFVLERMGSWVALACIGVLSCALYEFWAFYAVALLILAIWRIRPRWSSLAVRTRIAGVGTLFVFAASGAVNAWRLLHSSGNSNQESLLQMLDGTTYPVYLALIAAWFLGVCLHFGLEVRFQGRPPPRIFLSSRLRLRILIASFVLLIALCAIQHHTMIRYSYPFRTLNLILPLMYAGWLAMVTGQAAQGKIPAGGRMLAVVLTIWLVASENWMTAGWRDYQAWAAAVQRPAGESIYVAQPPVSPLAQAWIYPWSHSAQSFLSQALGTRSVNGIGFDPGAGWDPYGPGHGESLKSIAAEHGVTWK